VSVALPPSAPLPDRSRPTVRSSLAPMSAIPDPLAAPCKGADLGPLLDALAAPPERLRAEIPTLWPSLARRAGRTPLSGRVEAGDAIADLSAWRRCDAVGAALLFRAEPLPAGLVLDLFLKGDLEEKTAATRALVLLPLREDAAKVLEELQRSNVVAHFEAGVLDGNLLARALDAGLLDRGRFDRLVLKAAFLDLPLDRMIGVLERPGPNLSRMLQDLATEREAAGRAVWRDTCRLIAGAPVDGTVGRLLGALEHGDDRTRLAAARGLAVLKRADLRPFVEERRRRETRPEIREALADAFPADAL
jgi:hypothetical protein